MRVYKTTLKGMTQTINNIMIRDDNLIILVLVSSKTCGFLASATLVFVMYTVPIWKAITNIDKLISVNPVIPIDDNNHNNHHIYTGIKRRNGESKSNWTVYQSVSTSV